jgi:hypothetical protein
MSEPEMNGLTKREIASVIAKNMAFRMAVAIVNPTDFQTNVKELAELLAEDLVRQPRVARPKPRAA